MAERKRNKSYIKVHVRRIKNKKGDSFQIDYHDRKGNRHKRVVSNKKAEALSIARKIEEELNTAPYGINPLENKTVNLEELVDEFLSWKKGDVKKGTINRYKNYLNPFSEFLYNAFPNICGDVRLIEGKYIKEFRNVCLEKNKFSRRTINSALDQISSMFRYGIDQEYLSDNPVKKVKRLKILESNTAPFFTEDELAKIWKELDDHWVDFFQFIYLTGLRKGEAINLQWESVYLNESNPYIKIEGNDEWEPKTQSSYRVLQLNEPAVEILKRQKGNNDKYVFTNRKGKKIPGNTCYGALKRCLKRLDLLQYEDEKHKKENIIHKLRHTFASHLAMKGEDLYTLKELLGHESVEMVQKYAHLSENHTRRAMNKLSIE